eukprot:6302755-Prymnesium_polylepis.1
MAPYTCTCLETGHSHVVDEDDEYLNKVLESLKDLTHNDTESNLVFEQLVTYVVPEIPDATSFILADGVQHRMTQIILPDHLPTLRAALNRDHAALLYLVEEGKAEPEQNIDALGDACLHGAVRSGDVETCRLLLRASADVGCANNDGETPVMSACLYDRAEMLALMLAAESGGGAGSRATALVDAPLNCGITPLVACCRFGYSGCAA